MVIEKIKAIRELMDNNEEAAKQLTEAKTADKINPILAEYGIEMTQDDFAELKQMLEQEELPEDMLELVSGGSFKDWLWGWFDGLMDGWNETKDFFGKIGDLFSKNKAAAKAVKKKR